MMQNNLTVLTGAAVTRICFAGKRATGVEYKHQGQTQMADARLEVIVSLGAVQTPKLLMQSGIGDEAQLRPFSIPVIQHLPGVGQNLDDHISLGCVWEAAAVPLPLAPRSQAVCFSKTDSTLEAPNAMAYGIPHPYMTPENAAKYYPPSACWSISPGMRGHSRGYLRLTGPSPSDQLSIQSNYISDSDDLSQALNVVDMCRDIGNSAALRPFRRREVAPGKLTRKDLESFIRLEMV